MIIYLITNLDRMVAERGRELMIAYGSLKPPDAVHIATAAVSPGVEEMHTFDDRLLKLDGLIDKADGTKLKICKPDAGAPPAPLLETARGGKRKRSPRQPRRTIKEQSRLFIEKARENGR